MLTGMCKDLVHRLNKNNQNAPALFIDCFYFVVKYIFLITIIVHLLEVCSFLLL